MKKLKINLDDLQVDSFDTHPSGPAQFGTVRAYDDYDTNIPCSSLGSCGTGGMECTNAGATCDTTCNQFICSGNCSGLTVCDATCPGYWNATPTGC